MNRAYKTADTFDMSDGTQYIGLIPQYYEGVKVQPGLPFIRTKPKILSKKAAWRLRTNAEKAARVAAHS